MRIRFMVSAVVFPALCTSLPAQSLKALLLDRPLGDDPVRIEKVMDGKTELKDDGRKFPNHYMWETVFDAGDDWLRDVSFVIKNVSAKGITYLQVACELLETNDWQAELAKHKTVPIAGQASNAVGWRPEQALYSATLGHALGPDKDKRPAFGLAQGQEFTISLQDPASYPSLRSNVEASEPMSSVGACSGGPGQVFFEDGTQWQGHHYYRAAEQPGRWTRISFDGWAGITKTAE